MRRFAEVQISTHEAKPVNRRQQRVARWSVLAALAASACTAPARGDDAKLGGAAVLAKYCAKCHGAAKSEGDFGFVTDTKRLVAEGLVVPGDAARSQLYRRVADGEMPPEGVKARPSQAEIAALREWIDAMGTSATPFRGERDIAAVLAADEARLSRDARPHARWFTLTHLANAGAGDAQLERYRVALAALLASLTWSPSPPVPVAVDRERTIYRVDLRELGWTSAMWDTVRARYPYGVARGLRVPDSVRADWFVANASRPPLYHALLDLPASERELAHRLGIDLDDDIARYRVARAGFNRSGVSVNNRVIERHATRHGAYWRSYDFASSVGRENVFQHPLAFVPSGGEIIFNLPDGFQAYMLVDAKGRRIDKAPTTIVSDPRRLDRAVENGVSCMGCHASGIIPRTDEIRKIASSLERHDRDRVLLLHPPAETLAGLYERDRERFTSAYRAIRATPAAETADEPINVMVTRYEGELDLRTAAAELGLRPDELQARLARSYSLRQTLAALTKDGGTVKRDNWEARFARIVDELGVGVPFTPHASRDATPQVWIDRARATWVVAATGVDQATAIGICRGRNWELPRQGDLAAAVRDGLTVGLQLQRPLWSAGTKLDASNLRYAAVVEPHTGTARRADVVDRHDVVCVKR